MTSQGSNLDRLWRSLSSAGEDHAECEHALPQFVEAEMAGEDVASLFPAVQSHLDTCERCDALHAQMLDALMADASGMLPEVVNLPPPALPLAVRQMQWARSVAGAVLKTLGEWEEDLDLAAEAFFRALARSTGRLVPNVASSAFGLGPADSDALRLVMASYYALRDLAEEPDSDLKAMAGTQHMRLRLEQAAREEAGRLGLHGKATEAFVETFVEQALADLPQLLDLLSASPDNPPAERSD